MTTYEYGFLSKCAEAGLTGKQATGLLKAAESRLGHEIAGNVVGGLVPYVGSFANAIGSSLGGLNARDLSDEEIAELIEERGNGLNYVPGVGAYRLGQRAGVLAEAVKQLAAGKGVKKVRPQRHQFTEEMSILNPLNLVGLPVGMIAGAAGKHRTLDEQLEHDAKRQSLKNLLIPGYGGYHLAKRMGATRDVLEQKHEKEDLERAEYERLKKKFEDKDKNKKEDEKDDKED